MPAALFSARSDRVLSPGLKTRPTAHSVVSLVLVVWRRRNFARRVRTGVGRGFKTAVVRGALFSARSDRGASPGLKTRPTAHSVVALGLVVWGRRILGRRVGRVVGGVFSPAVVRGALFTARSDRVVSPGLKTRPTAHGVVAPGLVVWAQEFCDAGPTGCRAGLQTRRYARGSFHRARASESCRRV